MNHLEARSVSGVILSQESDLEILLQFKPVKDLFIETYTVTQCLGVRRFHSNGAPRKEEEFLNDLGYMKKE